MFRRVLATASLTSRSLLSRSIASASPVASEEQQRLTVDAAAFYNNSGPGGGQDRNWLLSNCPVKDGDDLTFTNHHFGIGEVQLPLAANSTPEQKRWDATDEEITAEIHRLEMAQVDLLVDKMGKLEKGMKMLDAGSGRGGTAFRTWQRGGRGPTIHGVTVAQDQADYANNLAKKSGLDRDVTFHVQNMLTLESHYSENSATSPFAPESFDQVYANETDMYIVDINHLYSQFFRLLKPSSATGTGRSQFTLASWVCSEKGGKYNKHEKHIDINYGTQMHTDVALVQAMEQAGFVNIEYFDLTKEDTPYWEVRNTWSHRSGVEPPFLNGYADGSLRYIMLTAQK